MNKTFKKSLALFISLIIILGNNVSIYAKENYTIYNSTMGEVMRHFEPEIYDQLPDDIKNYYDSTEAYKILGEDTEDSLPPTPTSRSGVIWVPSAIILTTAYKNRINDKKLDYGGNYSCTKSVQIIGYAYLVDSSNGDIVESTSVKKTKSTSASVRETVSRTKTDRKYYCKAIGHYYDYDIGVSKTTMQKTISFH